MARADMWLRGESQQHSLRKLRNVAKVDYFRDVLLYSRILPSLSPALRARAASSVGPAKLPRGLSQPQTYLVSI